MQAIDQIQDPWTIGESLAGEQNGRASLAEPALVRLIGRAARVHDAPELLDALARALQSPHAETRRQAAMALGKSGRAAAEAPLLASLHTNDPKLLRSVIEALGKIGGAASLLRLRELEPPETLKQVVERARLPRREREALRRGGGTGADEASVRGLELDRRRIGGVEDADVREERRRAHDRGHGGDGDPLVLSQGARREAEQRGGGREPSHPCAV